VLYGRENERRALGAVVDQARASRGGALVLRGEAGTGKSALLDDLAACDGAGAGLRILRTQGVESEAPLAFAALHRLLRPAFRSLGDLPPQQEQALRAVFGETTPPREGPEGRFLVFLAVLGLLAGLAEQQPVLCIIDDAHWLDEGSAAALLFVARRLEAERIALVFAAREGDARRFEAEGLPVLRLEGLAEEPAHALLRQRSTAPVSAGVAAELVRLAEGNPLALMELPAALSAEQLVGASALPARLPLTDRLERVFLDRFHLLPRPARTVLLVAAADDSGSLATVRAAAALLGADDAALEAAERSGLLRITGPALELRHPLVRSSLYAAALSSERRRAHAALAEVMTGREDLGRRTWHRAAALEEPDDAVAGDLEQVALNAALRGGHDAASATWERSAQLSTTAADRARRLHAAADGAWLAGAPQRARALAQEARPQTGDPRLLADIDRLRARIEWNLGSVHVGYGIMMRSAQEVVPTDPVRARRMAMVATALATFAGRPKGSVDPMDFIPPATVGDPPEARCFSDLLQGLNSIAGQDTAASVPVLRRAFAAAEHLEDWDLLANIGIAAAHIGDDATALDVHGRLIARAREDSAVVNIIYSLTRRGFAEVGAGRWAEAAAGAAEALQLARGTGQYGLTALPLAWLLLIATFRGEPAAEAHLAELRRVVSAHVPGVVGPVVDDAVRWAAAVSSAHTDPEQAFHHLQQLGNPVSRRMAIIDRLEVASRAGRREACSAWTTEIAAFAEATDCSWAHAAAEHGRALLAEPREADAHFRRALLHHDTGTRVFNRGRTELAYGEFLRRSRRRVDARGHLRKALAIFEDLGAMPWAERCRRELRASGATARRRDDAAPNAALTPQELHVARLVQQGMTSKDVAARLFVSPRTVDFHLRNVFAKLDITSRAALGHLPLGQSPEGP
jgi:DNA-binding CsgD family transcriptional regulator